MTHLSEARRGERLRRQLRLVAELLRGETLTRQKVARLLDVKLASADRHLRVLRDLPGVRAVGRGALSFDRSALLQQPSFGAAIAACLSHSVSSLFRGTSYEQSMREALDYVVSRTSRRALFRDLRRKFVFLAQGGESSLPEAGGRLDDVIDAVLHSKKMRVEYTRFAGKPETLTLEPLSVVVYEHQLYVLARSKVDGFRPYRFARISAVDVLDNRFSYPLKAEYDPEQLFANSLGIYIGDGPPELVTVRLKATHETYALSHRWHPTQHVQKTARGVLVSLNVRITPELLAWVLSFGGDAEVISPPSLRAEVARHAERLASAYTRPRSETR